MGELVRRSGVPFILFLLAIAVSYPVIMTGSPVGNILKWILIPVTAVLGGFTVWQFSNWNDDLFVLTTERIVHKEQVWPIRKSFEEGALENIEDIQTIQSGIVSNAFDYGDLILQTAGEKVEIDLTQVAHPAKLRALIFREITRNRSRTAVSLRSEVRDKLAGRLLDAPVVSSPEVEAESDLGQTSSVKLFWGIIKDYFFPSSWVESADGSTIRWRRFWLPGFFQHLKAFIPAVLWIVTGLLIFYYLFTFGNKTFNELIFWLAFWLFGSATLFVWLLWKIEDWSNDYFEITPGRIVVVYQKPLLFQRTRQEARLDNIQNISSESPGILAGFLKYGNVILETAGTQGQFELRWVRHPEKIRAEISKRQQAFRKRQNSVRARRRQEELLRWFDIYDDLKRQERGEAQRKQKFERQEKERKGDN